MRQKNGPRLARETRWDRAQPQVFMGLLAVPDVGVRNGGERLGADLAEQQARQN